MHQPVCVCEQPLCEGEGGGYYVTVRNDAGRTGFLLGPYAVHEQALANVDRGSALADKADPRAHWYAYGTARVRDGRLPRSVFGV